MKRFGEPFEKYEQFKVAKVSDVKVDSKEDKSVLASDAVDSKLTKSKASKDLELRKIDLDFLKEAPDKKSILQDINIAAAQAANLYAINPKQKGLSQGVKQNLPYFDYYMVELGLNVRVGREAKIPQLLFTVDLYSDSQERTDVVTNSIAPTDVIKKTKVVEGKVTLGVSKLLEFIPVAGTVASKLLSIDINPIEFKAELAKCAIDASGQKLSYNVSWKIYETENVQGFNPVMMLKVRKSVTKIWADVKVSYLLQTGWFKEQEVETEPITVKILPV